MIQRRNSDLDIEERFTRDITRLPESDLDRIASAYRQLLESVGEDSDREGLRRTPDRAARAFEFLTQGYRQDLEEFVVETLTDNFAGSLLDFADIDQHSVAWINGPGKNKIRNVIATRAVTSIGLRTENP